MNFGTVIGTIWATQRHPTTERLSLRIVRPEDAEGNDAGDPLVAVDTMSAGVGERVFYVTAREAVIAIAGVEEAPIDAAIVGIVEGIESVGSRSWGRP